jgi:hypothetical protein
MSMRSLPHLRRRGAVSAALAGACLMAGAPVGAQALSSGAHPRGHSAALSFPNGYTTELACASPSQCTTVAANGVQVTFNPTRGAVVRSQTIAPSLVDSPLSIACVSGRMCIVADARGDVAVFDPRRAKGKAASFVVSGASYQTSLACSSRSHCVAESYQSVAVFNPGHLGSPVSSPFSANGNGAQASVSCPSSTQCTGSNGNDGHLYTYDPSRASAAVAQAITSSPQVGMVDCPTTSFCVALASPKSNPAVNTGLITFNPRRLGNPRVRLLSQTSLEFITCVTSTLCAAAGNNGGVLVFDPHSPGRHRFTGVPYGNDLVGIAFASRSELVLLGNKGQKAVIDPRRPPKRVALIAFSKATKINRG